jgi:tetratricopeptide (TPR) repeat protein
LVFDVARHWSIVAAADSTAASAAARWAVLAGDAAAAAADIDEAIIRYEQADRLWGIGTREHATTLIRLGNALTALGNNAEADERFRAARHVAEGLGDVELFARAAIGLAATVRYGHSDPERITALERAIATLDPGDDVLRPTAAAMLKRQLGFDSSDDAWVRRQHAARIVADAVTADEPRRELLLSLGAARDSIVVDDPVVLGRLSRSIVEAGTSPRNLPVLANAWYGQAWSTLELADGPGWHEAVTAFTTIADELGLPYERALAATMATTTALIEGRYEDAEASSQHALKLGTEAGDPNASAVHLTGAVMRGLDLGQATAMIGLMDAMRDELADVPTFWGGFAITAAEAGAADLARELFATRTEAGFDRVRRDLEWLPVIGFFAYTCAKLDDTDYAPILYDLLAASPARAVRVGPLAGWWGPTDYHLGALCRVMGRLDEAESRLRAALDVTVRLDARPWQARTQLELARVLELAHGRGAGPTSSVLRASAAAIAADLGAVGLTTIRS